MSIIIVDYGVGNIKSIQNAFKSLNVGIPKLSNNYKDLRDASGLILPGVGAFEACINNLEKFKLIAPLNELVIERKKPILGICVGMQLMANSSTEGGMYEGLGWIPGEVVHLDNSRGLQVPHVGWNDITTRQKNALLESINDGSHFYFDHSYHFVCDTNYVAATVDYGVMINAAVNHDNIFGVQFHPEKSANTGLKLFRGFNNYVLKNVEKKNNRNDFHS